MKTNLQGLDYTILNDILAYKTRKENWLDKGKHRNYWYKNQATQLKTYQQNDNLREFSRYEMPFGSVAFFTMLGLDKKENISIS